MLPRPHPAVTAAPSLAPTPGTLPSLSPATAARPIFAAALHPHKQPQATQAKPKAQVPPETASTKTPYAAPQTQASPKPPTSAQPKASPAPPSQPPSLFRLHYMGVIQLRGQLRVLRPGRIRALPARTLDSGGSH